LNDEKILDMIRGRARKVYEIDGLGIATKLGNILVVNTILLGALSAIPENLVKPDSVEKAIAGRLEQKYVALNLEAFKMGRKRVNLG